MRNLCVKEKLKSKNKFVDPIFTKKTKISQYWNQLGIWQNGVLYSFISYKKIIYIFLK